MWQFAVYTGRGVITFVVDRREGLYIRSKLVAAMSSSSAVVITCAIGDFSTVAVCGPFDFTVTEIKKE